MMADEYRPNRHDGWNAQWSRERTAAEDRAIRRDLLARIAAGETWLRSSLPPRRWDAKPHTQHAPSCSWHKAPVAVYCDCARVATGAIELHAGASLSSERSVLMINPKERTHYDGAFVLAFGAYGSTYLHVYAESLDDAIEQCAAWLADHMPGHIMKEWDEDHTALVREACEERGLVYPPAAGADLESEGYYAAQEDAEADLTRTESGFLTSHEWTVVLEDPSVEDLYNFVWGE